MMETMIPPQVGMRLRTKKRGHKKEDKRPKQKNERKQFLWLMSSPWIISSLTLPPLLASLVPCNFCRYHTPTIYLPQNSHHTYLLWHFHNHSEIYCNATFHRFVYYDTLHHCHIALHDHVVDIVFVAKPPFIIFYTCHSWFIAHPGTPPEAFI